MLHKNPRTAHQMPMLFLFLLIGLFAATSLTLTLIGTRVYRDVAAEAELSGDAQMLLSYVGNKVHAYDTAGGVTIETRGGLSSLCLYETLDGMRYETAIYAYQNAVWERFAPAGEAIEPENGERLIAAASLDLSMPARGLIEARVALADGEARTLRVALRTAEAEGV